MATATTSIATATNTTQGQGPGQDPSDSLDPWTPEQELTLLKALVKYKPAGIHAHFRMLSIRQYLLASNVCTADEEHTRIPGIWAKLRTLYDLDALDEREDSVISSTATDDDTQTGAAYWRDFELPRDEAMGGDFESLMWERRLAPEGTGSPEWSAGGANERNLGGKARRESTVPGTDEPRSSPVASAPTRGRGGRRGGRVSRLKGEAEVGETRSSRRGSKAASELGTKDDDGDENMEDAEDDEEGSSDSDEEEDESEEPDEEEKRGPAKRGRGGRRGRGRRGRRRG